MRAAQARARSTRARANTHATRTRTCTQRHIERRRTHKRAIFAALTLAPFPWRFRYGGACCHSLAVGPAHSYQDYADATRAIKAAGDQIREHGLPAAVSPFVVTVCGTGNVSRGARETPSPMPRDGTRHQPWATLSVPRGRLAVPHHPWALL
jgi:hypothetical protein